MDIHCALRAASALYNPTSWSAPFSLVPNLPKCQPISPHAHGLAIHESQAHGSKIAAIEAAPPVIPLHPHMPSRDYDFADLHFPVPAQRPLSTTQSIPPFHPRTIYNIRIAGISPVRVDGVAFNADDPLDADLIRLMRFPKGNDIAAPYIPAAQYATLYEDVVFYAGFMSVRRKRRRHG